MTGSIQTLRVDKGFGFIKDEAGKEYFFHRSAVNGEGLENLKEGDGVEFDLGEGPRGRGPRTSGAQRPSGTDGTRTPVRGISCHRTWSASVSSASVASPCSLRSSSRRCRGPRCGTSQARIAKRRSPAQRVSVLRTYNVRTCCSRCLQATGANCTKLASILTTYIRRHLRP